MPQPPQLARSVSGSTQRLSQATEDEGQSTVQRELTQLLPGGQTIPQAPQWLRSMRRSAQKVAPPPSGTPPSVGAEQVARSAAQVVVQAPSLHTWPAGQRRSQAPQFWRSVRKLAHTPPQAFCPVGQLRVQTPEEHTWACPQALAQPPQLARSDAVSTHCPPQRLSLIHI